MKLRKPYYKLAGANDYCFIFIDLATTVPVTYIMPRRRWERMCGGRFW